MNIDGRVLELARLGRGLSRDELSKLLDVSPRTIANWEKAGVPDHRVNLVMSRFGAEINSAIPEIQYLDYIETPDGKKQYEEWLETQAKYHGYDNPESPLLSIRDALRPYSTESLINEIRLRVSELESKIQELQDPDYSQLSDEDVRKNEYGLAAKPADPNIGFDDLPNEP